ncbi:zinc finger protein 185 [Pygocentrus nattereri]|nr:zinc finger protein 185 [Pygocentrus nattereri]
MPTPGSQASPTGSASQSMPPPVPAHSRRQLSNRLSLQTNFGYRELLVMSTGDRQSVLRTTKVRTTLKGDNSWIQRRKDTEEEEEQKPWIAEVRASRVNGAFSDTPPETTPTQPEPEPKLGTDSPKAPASGYLIRGVFTKTDTKPTSPKSTNGYSGTSVFNKKSSEGYKKIAPHTVRPSLESTAGETDPAVSKEEQERRTEAASNVLKSSAARQRSYVLSAAKKYEIPPEKPDSSDPPVISFVAKRVVISDDEDSDSAAKPPAAPAPPNPPAQPAPKQSAEMSVDGLALPVAPLQKKVPSATPEPTPRTNAEPTPKKSGNALDALSDTLMSSTPAPTSVSKPVAEVIPPAPEAKKAPSTAPEPKTEPTPKPSATEPVTPAVPVAKEAPSTAPEPKPKAEPTPKASVTEPVAPQKVPAATPEPQPKAEPTPKTSAATPTTPAAPATQKAPTAAPEIKQEPVPKQSVTEPLPAAQKAPSTTPAPKQEQTPKQSVTEPSAQVPPVDPVAAEKKAPAATPEVIKQPTPKPSVTEPVPAAPVQQKAPSTTPVPKAEPTPKPSVTEPVPAPPVAQKAPSTTPEPKPKTEPAPKPSVTEPVPAPSTTPEPKPKTEPAPKPSVTEPVPAAPAALKTPSTTPEPKPKTEPTPKKSVAEPVPAAPVPLTTPEPKPKTEPTPKARVDPKLVKKTNDLNDDDLLGLTQSAPQKPVNPVPTTTDLLSGADSSLPKTEKTKKSLDLLADDVIPFNTNPDKSSTETVNITTTKTETITQNSSLPQSQKTQEPLDLLVFDLHTKNDKPDADKTQSKFDRTKTVTRPKEELLSSADPFDPIPIVSECTKSPVELFDPLLSDSGNLPADALSSLAKDVIPIDTDITSLSGDTSKKPSDSSVPGANQRSSDNVSPWDRWTSPILNTTTENREADPQPMETSYTPYTRRVDRSALEPKSLDNDIKKGIVYVKEYVNTPELPTYNSSDVDYVTSTSSNYAYSSPSSTNMTACTYCGGLVGNDAKITIEHLNISCHPECFKCGICSKPMGDFLHSMFLHRGTVHCESCYANVL